MTHGCCVYQHFSNGRTPVVLTVNDDQRREVMLTSILKLRSILARNRRSDCLRPSLYEKGGGHPFKKNKGSLLVYQFFSLMLI